MQPSEPPRGRIVSFFGVVVAGTAAFSYAVGGSTGAAYGAGAAVAGSLLGIPFAIWLWHKVNGG
jgi:hypothetical protein